MPVFKRVLVAADFSEASGRAVELAAAIARDTGAELHVVTVCEIPDYGGLPTSIDLVTPLTEIAERRLGELVASLRGVVPGAKGTLKIGVAWEQILAAAEELAPDLLVLGTHGRRGMAHAIMGSVAERVVRTSPFPVLTVRSRVADAR